jgi:hypothetical protein
MGVSAMIGSAVIGGGASIYGANKAAKASKNATQAANDLQRYQYDTTRADQAPWRAIGGQAIGALGQGFGFDTSGYGGSTVNWGQYGQANPDVAAGWQDMLQSGEAQEKFNGDPNAYYQWHYQNYGQNEGRQAPTAAAGTGAAGGSQVPNFLDTFGKDDFEADPGYEWLRNETLRAVDGRAAAAGGYASGGRDKARMRYASGLANQSYGDAYNRFNNDRTMIYNRLSNLAGMGQTANNAIAGAGQNYANQVGQNNLNNAAVQAGAANQTAGAIGQFGQNALNYFGQPGMVNQYGSGQNLSPMSVQSLPSYTAAPAYQTPADFVPNNGIGAVF